MSRWFAIFLGLALPFVLLVAACGGDDDDGGSSGDDDDDDSEDIGRSDNSNATGKLTIDGKDYTMDMETCEISMGAGKLTVLAAKLKGGELTDFSASGIEADVAIAVVKGDKGFIGTGTMKLDGKSVSYDGDVYDPTAPGKPVKLKFSTKC